MGVTRGTNGNISGNYPRDVHDKKTKSALSAYRQRKFFHSLICQCYCSLTPYLHYNFVDWFYIISDNILSIFGSNMIYIMA